MLFDKHEIAMSYHSAIHFQKIKKVGWTHRRIIFFMWKFLQKRARGCLLIMKQRKEELYLIHPVLFVLLVKRKQLITCFSDVQQHHIRGLASAFLYITIQWRSLVDFSQSVIALQEGISNNPQHFYYYIWSIWKNRNKSIYDMLKNLGKLFGENVSLIKEQIGMIVKNSNRFIIHVCSSLDLNLHQIHRNRKIIPGHHLSLIG